MGKRKSLFGWLPWFRKCKKQPGTETETKHTTNSTLSLKAEKKDKKSKKFSSLPDVFRAAVPGKKKDKKNKEDKLGVRTLQKEASKSSHSGDESHQTLPYEKKQNKLQHATSSSSSSDSEIIKNYTGHNVTPSKHSNKLKSKDVKSTAVVEEVNDFTETSQELRRTELKTATIVHINRDSTDNYEHYKTPQNSQDTDRINFGKSKLTLRKMTSSSSSSNSDSENKADVDNKNGTKPQYRKKKRSKPKTTTHEKGPEIRTNNNNNLSSTGSGTSSNTNKLQVVTRDIAVQVNCANKILGQKVTKSIKRKSSSSSSNSNKLKQSASSVIKHPILQNGNYKIGQIHNSNIENPNIQSDNAMLPVIGVNIANRSSTSSLSSADISRNPIYSVVKVKEDVQETKQKLKNLARKSSSTSNSSEDKVKPLEQSMLGKQILVTHGTVFLTQEKHLSDQTMHKVFEKASSSDSDTSLELYQNRSKVEIENNTFVPAGVTKEGVTGNSQLVYTEAKGKGILKETKQKIKNLMRKSSRTSTSSEDHDNSVKTTVLVAHENILSTKENHSHRHKNKHELHNNPSSSDSDTSLELHHNNLSAEIKNISTGSAGVNVANSSSISSISSREDVARNPQHTNSEVKGKGILKEARKKITNLNKKSSSSSSSEDQANYLEKNTLVHPLLVPQENILPMQEHQTEPKIYEKQSSLNSDTSLKLHNNSSKDELKIKSLDNPNADATIVTYESNISSHSGDSSSTDSSESTLEQSATNEIKIENKHIEISSILKNTVSETKMRKSSSDSSSSTESITPNFENKYFTADEISFEKYSSNDSEVISPLYFASYEYIPTLESQISHRSSSSSTDYVHTKVLTKMHSEKLPIVKNDIAKYEETKSSKNKTLTSSSSESSLESSKLSFRSKAIEYSKMLQNKMNLKFGSNQKDRNERKNKNFDSKGNIVSDQHSALSNTINQSNSSDSSSETSVKVHDKSQSKFYTQLQHKPSIESLSSDSEESVPTQAFASDSTTKIAHAHTLSDSSSYSSSNESINAKENISTKVLQHNSEIQSQDNSSSSSSNSSNKSKNAEKASALHVAITDVGKETENVYMFQYKNERHRTKSLSSSDSSFVEVNSRISESVSKTESKSRSSSSSDGHSQHNISNKKPFKVKAKEFSKDLRNKMRGKPNPKSHPVVSEYDPQILRDIDLDTPSYSHSVSSHPNTSSSLLSMSSLESTSQSSVGLEETNTSKKKGKNKNKIKLGNVFANMRVKSAGKKQKKSSSESSFSIESPKINLRNKARDLSEEIRTRLKGKPKVESINTSSDEDKQRDTDGVIDSKRFYESLYDTPQQHSRPQLGNSSSSQESLSQSNLFYTKDNQKYTKLDSNLHAETKLTKAENILVSKKGNIGNRDSSAESSSSSSSKGKFKIKSNDIQTQILSVKEQTKTSESKRFKEISEFTKTQERLSTANSRSSSSSLESLNYEKSGEFQTNRDDVIDEANLSFKEKVYFFENILPKGNKKIKNDSSSDEHVHKKIKTKGDSSSDESTRKRLGKKTKDLSNKIRSKFTRKSEAKVLNLEYNKNDDETGAVGRGPDFSSSTDNKNDVKQHHHKSVTSSDSSSDTSTVCDDVSDNMPFAGVYPMASNENVVVPYDTFLRKDYYTQNKKSDSLLCDDSERGTESITTHHDSINPHNDTGKSTIFIPVPKVRNKKPFIVTTAITKRQSEGSTSSSSDSDHREKANKQAVQTHEDKTIFKKETPIITISNASENMKLHHLVRSSSDSSITSNEGFETKIRKKVKSTVKLQPKEDCIFTTITAKKVNKSSVADKILRGSSSNDSVTSSDEETKLQQQSAIKQENQFVAVCQVFPSIITKETKVVRSSSDSSVHSSKGTKNMVIKEEINCESSPGKAINYGITTSKTEKVNQRPVKSKHAKKSSSNSVSSTTSSDDASNNILKDVNNVFSPLGMKVSYSNTAAGDTPEKIKLNASESKLSKRNRSSSDSSGTSNAGVNKTSEADKITVKKALTVKQVNYNIISSKIPKYVKGFDDNSLTVKRSSSTSSVSSNDDVENIDLQELKKPALPPKRNNNGESNRISRSSSDSSIDSNGIVKPNEGINEQLSPTDRHNDKRDSLSVMDAVASVIQQYRHSNPVTTPKSTIASVHTFKKNVELKKQSKMTQNLVSQNKSNSLPTLILKENKEFEHYKTNVFEIKTSDMVVVKSILIESKDDSPEIKPGTSQTSTMDTVYSYGNQTATAMVPPVREHKTSIKRDGIPTITLSKSNRSSSSSNSSSDSDTKKDSDNNVHKDAYEVQEATIYLSDNNAYDC